MLISQTAVTKTKNWFTQKVTSHILYTLYISMIFILADKRICNFAYDSYQDVDFFVYMELQRQSSTHHTITVQELGVLA